MMERFLRAAAIVCALLFGCSKAPTPRELAEGAWTTPEPATLFDGSFPFTQHQGLVLTHDAFAWSFLYAWDDAEDPLKGCRADIHAEGTWAGTDCGSINPFEYWGHKDGYAEGCAAFKVAHAEVQIRGCPAELELNDDAPRQVAVSYVQDVTGFYFDRVLIQVAENSLYLDHAEYVRP